jgi:hypothetical protein
MRSAAPPLDWALRCRVTGRLPSREQTIERSGRQEVFGQIERGARRDTEAAKQRRMQTVEAGTAGSDAIR